GAGPTLPGRRASSTVPAASAFALLFHRLAHDLFDGRDAVHHLAQAAPAQRDHPFVNRLAPELEARRADENQLAQLLADLHHFVQADAALVARLVALLAAGALLRRHLLRLFGREPGLNERRRRHRVVLLAVRADAAHQALRANQVDRARDEKR